jgi:hypothetical protein
MARSSTAETLLSWTEGLQRPRYFARQLVTPAELNLESRYFIERLRRHNRLLHGWGVVCGLQVCRVPTADGSGAEPWKVKIRPGDAIDGYGSGIHVDVDRIVDLRATSTAAASGDPPGEVRDAWCAPVWTDRPAGPVWIAICHRERLARPVRIQPSGCGCDDVGCEYSRWQDGYEVRILDAPPPSCDATPPTPQEFLDSLTGPLRDCPPCPDDPCVVLARVEHDTAGVISAVDNCSCRRNVVSLANLWWRCAGGLVTVKEVALTPAGDTAAGKTVKVAVKGDNFHPDAEVSLGAKIAISDLQVTGDGQTARFAAKVAKDAALGPRALVVSNPDCSTATYANALTVVAAPTPKKAAPPPKRR